jgi:hypothetical protein
MSCEKASVKANTASCAALPDVKTSGFMMKKSPLKALITARALSDRVHQQD